MRTTISERRRKFYALVRAANEQPTPWLVAALQDRTHNAGYMSPLSRLACLRILACRDKSGRTYPERKRIVRQTYGI